MRLLGFFLLTVHFSLLLRAKDQNTLEHGNCAQAFLIGMANGSDYPAFKNQAIINTLDDSSFNTTEIRIAFQNLSKNSLNFSNSADNYSFKMYVNLIAKNLFSVYWSLLPSYNFETNSEDLSLIIKTKNLYSEVGEYLDETASLKKSTCLLKIKNYHELIHKSIGLMDNSWINCFSSGFEFGKLNSLYFSKNCSSPIFSTPKQSSTNFARAFFLGMITSTNSYESAIENYIDDDNFDINTINEAFTNVCKLHPWNSSINSWDFVGNISRVSDPLRAVLFEVYPAASNNEWQIIELINKTWSLYDNALRFYKLTSKMHADGSLELRKSICSISKKLSFDEYFEAGIEFTDLNKIYFIANDIINISPDFGPEAFFLGFMNKTKDFLQLFNIKLNYQTFNTTKLLKAFSRMADIQLQLIDEYSYWELVHAVSEAATPLRNLIYNIYRLENPFMNETEYKLEKIYNLLKYSTRFADTTHFITKNGKNEKDVNLIKEFLLISTLLSSTEEKNYGDFFKAGRLFDEFSNIYVNAINISDTFQKKNCKEIQKNKFNNLYSPNEVNTRQRSLFLVENYLDSPQFEVCSKCENSENSEKIKMDGNFDRSICQICTNLYDSCRSCRNQYKLLSCAKCYEEIFNYLHQKGVLSLCPGELSNCKICLEKENGCDRCFSGYYLFSGNNSQYKECVKCDSRNQFALDGKCFNCSAVLPNCKECQNKSETCSLCEFGYFLKKSNQGENYLCSTCSDSNHFINLTSGLCKHCSELYENCLSCSGNPLKCDSCFDGYFIDKENCEKCSSKYGKRCLGCSRLNCEVVSESSSFQWDVKISLLFILLALICRGVYTKFKNRTRECRGEIEYIPPVENQPWTAEEEEQKNNFNNNICNNKELEREDNFLENREEIYKEIRLDKKIKKSNKNKRDSGIYSQD